MISDNYLTIIRELLLIIEWIVSGKEEVVKVNTIFSPKICVVSVNLYMQLMNAVLGWLLPCVCIIRVYSDNKTAKTVNFSTPQLYLTLLRSATL